MRLKTAVTIILATALSAGLASCGTTPPPTTEPSTGPHETPESGLSTVAGAVEDGLSDLVSSGALVGAEAVLQQGTEVENVTVGLGDIDTEEVYPEGGHTRIASVTKAFTSAIILQLVQEGTIDLDGTLEDYLPGLIEGEGIEADQITVRQLLRHESGLPELQADPDDPDATYTARELLALIDSQAAQFPPGEQMRYTNTNYVLAGLLIEEMTGHDYADELDRRIAAPLGLTGTYLPEAGDRTLPDPSPRGYQDVNGALTDVTAEEPSAAYTSGGVVSNGADLNRFFTALLAGEVVPPELLDTMRETVPMPDVPGVDYGLGLMRLPVSCEAAAWGQAGNVDGFQAMVATTGDRSVSLQLNQGPTEDLGPAQLLGLLDAALC